MTTRSNVVGVVVNTRPKQVTSFSRHTYDGQSPTSIMKIAAKLSSTHSDKFVYLQNSLGKIPLPVRKHFRNSTRDCTFSRTLAPIRHIAKYLRKAERSTATSTTTAKLMTA